MLIIPSDLSIPDQGGKNVFKERQKKTKEWTQ